jgi:multisubunit Na+/H+ antiporter MnhE subunit
VTRYVAAVVALTLVYALALASFHPWDLAIGAVLAAALLFAARYTVRRTGDGAERPSSSEPMASRPNLLGRVRAFFPFAVAIGRDVLAGAWRVFLATVGLRRPLSPGVVAVPLGERTPNGVAVSAFIAAFTPDTLLVGVDEEKRVMLIHAIDAANPDAVRESQQEFYRRYQGRVFP